MRENARIATLANIYQQRRNVWEFIIRAGTQEGRVSLIGLG